MKVSIGTVRESLRKTTNCGVSSLSLTRKVDSNRKHTRGFKKEKTENESTLLLRVSVIDV